MKGEINIIPGKPNDDNREYLPEAIKGSDMVVNENGNNSQAYPQRLEEHTEEVLEGIKETWYEYVPESYDGSKKVPLVISMHGGLMTGWGQAIYTSWTLVADREGFIVLFPNANKRRFWIVEVDKDRLEQATTPQKNGVYLNMPPESPDDNHDMNYIIALIEKMKEKYSIDEGRIFMQGMSMGNMMTAQFARYHGDLLAGMAGSAGPSDPALLFDEEGNIINRKGPLAVWQTRCEHDKVPPGFKYGTDYILKANRDYWMAINECDALLEIKIIGEDNFAFYKGKHGDFVFRDVKNRDHGQTFDDAELVWDYLFSGVRRGEDGKIINTDTILPRKGDKYAIALSDGSSKAYLNNELVEMSGPVFIHRKLKYHGLNGDAIVRGEYFMAPVSFVAKALNGKIAFSDGGKAAQIILPDGRCLQFARGIIGCLVDGRVHSMLCEAVFRNGELYVPVEWVCRLILDNHVSRCNGVLYITDHYSVLSSNMADIIDRELLE